MATLQQLSARIIRHANRRYGKPYLLAVRPISDWSLPVGFAYDQDVDVIRNVAGTVLDNVSDYWATDTVYIVPTRYDWRDDAAEMFRLAAGGLVNAGTVEVWVGHADIAKMRLAHRVKLGLKWYDVDNQQEAPSGYPDTEGLWSRVRLIGRADYDT